MNSAPSAIETLPQVGSVAAKHSTASRTGQLQRAGWTAPLSAAEVELVRTVLGHFGGQVVMFGGSTAGGVLNNETWAIDGGVWTQCLSPNCTTPTPPSVRCCVGLAYFTNANPALRGLILYGGQTLVSGVKTNLSGTWRFDGNNWSCLTTCD